VKCHSCSSPATVHLTEIVSGKKKELHLCQDCAEKQQVLKKQELNLPAHPPNLDRPAARPAPRTADDRAGSIDLSSLRDKVHGVSGRGPTGLPTRLRGVSRRTATAPGADPPVSPACRQDPRRGPANAALLAEVVELRRLLREAVEAEAYEEAARLRDLLRQKEATDESG